MRQKRAKAYKKQMSVYTHTFKFREPYQIIVDNEIVSLCQTSAFDISKGFTRTIQAEHKPMITQCCIQALYDSKNQNAIDMAKSFERRKCNHREPIDPSDCILSIVDIKGENKHRYVVATQDLNLRKKLRKVPGVPLIYMNRSVMVMEPISDASRLYNEKVEKLKLTAGLNDTGAGVVKNNEEESKEGEGEPVKKKRKGPKEPNPLSVKKKKNTPAVSQEEPKKKPNRRKTNKKKTDTEGETEEKGAEVETDKQVDDNEE
ncbi:UTP23 rRNA-processing protein UTP23 [Candida maltosa Xu316]|uniref:U three protein 23 n=1 Tax=Candida maltosa (strain Xu316) TaxID=1245528 RepID=M3IQT8_CANMX|nr:rRNA-processing protein, putative [Candida maltosa Xu316]